MASLAQRDGTPRRFSKSGPGTGGKMIKTPDLRHVTVLRQNDWVRIQDEVNGVDKEKERLSEAAERREALRLQSKQVVKLWPDTIAGQRQKKLEAKKIREQIEEEKRKRIDAEEAEYRERKQKEASRKARIHLYYQTDRVKGLHRALLHTEVLKEREAQRELKEKMKRAAIDKDKKFLEITTTRDTEALRRNREKAAQKKLEQQAAAEDLKNQIKANELARKQQKLERIDDAAEIQHLQELYQFEQKVESEREANQRRNLMRARLDHLINRAQIKEQEAEKLKAEEEQRKLFIAAKDKMTKLRKEREKQLFNEAQQCRERILTKLSAVQQEQADNEEQRIIKAQAERDARQAQLQLEEERKKADMLRSIAAHRELLRKEKEHLDKIVEQENKDALQAKREADKIHAKSQQVKAEKRREELRKLHDFNVAQMAEKSARLQQMKEEEIQLEARNTKLSAEEEVKFQEYSQQVIKAAAEARRNVFPLHKAALSGVGPSYLVHDVTGAQMPRYISATTESVRKLHQAGDIHQAKKRLGFTW